MLYFSLKVVDRTVMPSFSLSVVNRTVILYLFLNVVNRTVNVMLYFLLSALECRFAYFHCTVTNVSTDNGNEIN